MVMGMGTSVPLGQATGQIVIDVASVKQAVTYIEQASKQIAAAFQQVNVAVAQTSTIIDRGAQSITRSFQNIGREATSVSRAGAAVSSLGKNIQEGIRTGEKAVQTSTANINRSLKQMFRSMPNRTGLFEQFFEEKTGINLREQAREMEKAAREQQRLSKLIPTYGTGGLSSFESQFAVAMEADQRRADAAIANMAGSVQQYENLAQRFGEAGRAFAPISLAAGVAAGIGIKTASDIEQLQIRFTALEGSAEAAAAQMSVLTDEARRFGLPVTETLAALARLSPILKTTGNDTERFVGLIARLVALNPQQGFEGAAIAVSEALSGTGNDFRSLQERFNIPRNLLRQAVAETSNFADALDLALNRLGTTEQSAIAVGQSFLGSFRRAKDEAMRLLAAGLRPILDNGITPLLQGLANIAQFFNENLRAVASLAGGFLILGTAVSPVLLALGQVAALLARIKEAGPGAAAALGMVGRAGLAGLAIAGGVEAGLGISRLIRPEIGTQEDAREQLANAIGQLAAIIGTWASALVDPISRFVFALTKGAELVGSAIQLVSTAIVTGAQDIIVSVGEKIADIARDLGDVGLSEQIRDGIRNLQLNQRAQMLRVDPQTGREMAAYYLPPGTSLADIENNSALAAWVAQEQELADQLGQTLTFVDSAQGRMETLKERILQGFEPTPQELSDLNSRIETFRWSWVEGAMRVGDVLAELLGGNLFSDPTVTPDAGTSRRSGFGFNEDEIEAFRRYQEGLADLEESYGEQRRQVMENLHRQLVDLQERYEDQVAKLQDTEMRRREKAQRDLDKSIADIQEDSAEDQKKAYKDLQDEIAKILRDSRITVLEAASRLDARAIFEEQRRTRQRLDDLNRNYSEEEAERQKQTEDRIQQMRDDFALEEQERRADFDRRMAELAAENAKQRARMVADGQRRLDDLEYQNRVERNRRQNAFITELNDLSDHGRRVRDLHRMAQFAVEADLAAWVTRMSQAFTRVQPYVVQTNPYQQVFPGQRIITQYDTGTSYVPMTGAYTLHQGEGVLDPTTNALLRAALGGSYNMAEARRMFSGGGSGVNIDMRGVTVPIYGDIGGYNERDIQRMFSGALDEFFSQAAVRIQM